MRDRIRFALNVFSGTVILVGGFVLACVAAENAYEALRWMLG